MRGKRFAAVMAITLILLFARGAGQAQEKSKAPKRIAIRAGRLIDGKSDAPLANALIVIEGEEIVSVSAGGAAPGGVEVIDLSNATVLPGLVDTHTHVLLNGDITSEDYDAQLLKESIPYRAILSARNARIALEHGFTTMRDLETEGAMYADVDIKKAIANGEVPGPRMQVATRAMTPTGMYPLLGYSWELQVPKGVQYVDGVEGARKAVREQVMYGADWIKYYSDRRYHFEADGVLHSMVNFTDEEAKAIVDETHRLGKKVAAHAIGSDGIAAALRAGVDSIEHGDGLTDTLMDEMELDEDGGPGEGCVSESSEEKGQDCTRNRCGRVRLEGTEPSQGVWVLRELRDDADAGDSFGNGRASGAARLERQDGHDRGGEVGGRGRGERRSVERHYRARAGQVCDEGRSDFQE